MPYKILSLDGGGSWALLEALTLGELYGLDTSGKDILNRFDLVASNSGGSIVLAGLAADFTPRMLLDLLNNESKRKLIFVKRFRFLPFLGVEKYDTAAKLTGLRTVLGTRGDMFLNALGLKCKLLIAAFDYNRLRAQFFRSDINSPAAGTAGAAAPTLAEAAHASSNAPIKYFDAPAQFATPAFAGYRYWDGAMGGFNNPTMAAVIEALSYGVQGGELRTLSIGTANVFLPMAIPLPAPGAPGQNPLCVEIDNSSLLHDLKLAAAVILDDPPDQASFQAHLITSGAGALSRDPAKPVTDGNIVRMNPWIQPVQANGKWIVPPLLKYMPKGLSISENYSSDAEIFAALVKLDMDAVEQNEVELISTLGAAWLKDAVPNQAIRATSDLRPLIGHDRFSAAKAQAEAIGLA